MRVSSEWLITEADAAVSKTGWNLKCPEDASLNLLGAQVLADPDHAQSEDIGVFRAIGRSTAITVSSGIHGEDLTLALKASTDSEWAAVIALREYAGVLYLESPYGWARYIRVVSRSWKETGPATAGRRTLQLGCVEVASP